jgi:hypothetical protein
MTTPLGELTLGPREGRRVTVAARRARLGHGDLGLDGRRLRRHRDRVHDHLPGRSPITASSTSRSRDGDLQVDEHHTVETALVLGAAFARRWRPGWDRLIGQSSVPMDESLATPYRPGGRRMR